jgi:chemotaxis protein histidine kinase CheA
VLKGLEAVDVPPAAKPLAAFDRRALATGTARARLHKVVESDEWFRERVVEKFLERPEVASVLEDWDPGAAGRQVIEAAAAGRLPALASALWAGRPPGSDFALGLAVAAWEAERQSRQDEEERRSLDERLASVAESARRAEEGKRTAEQERDRLEGELREERRGRRAREQQAADQVTQASRQVLELEAALAAARSETETVQARVAREAERANRAEEAERAARSELAALGPGRQTSVPPEALQEAAQAAARLAESLAKLADGKQPPASPPARRPSPAHAPERAPVQRRVRAAVPPGMVSDSLEGVEAVVRTPGIELVVDGYNVSMAAWPEASPAEQRDRLCGALAELQLRIRRPVTVVFDGADVEGVRHPRRPGLRIAFSAPGQEADEVVVAEVAARPPEVPMLVVSSDAWVRDNAEAEGALVIPVGTLLAFLRR